jgi:phosphinothricin acetyltransferase
MVISFETIKESDLQKVKEIYDYYIEHSMATFHTSPISIELLKESVFIEHPIYKSFLIKTSDEICGYCYLTQYKKRQAYDRTAEFSIYLKPGYERKGIGCKALEYLESSARKTNIKVLIGAITASNKASIALCEKLGYEKCAHYRQVGEKFGQVLDVVAYQKIL